MENYRAAKAKLFAISNAAVLNADDAAMSVMRAAMHTAPLLYSIENEADLRAANIESIPHGWAYDVMISGETYRFEIPVKGRFNIYNSLAAIGAVHLLGVAVHDIRHAAASLPQVPGRIQAVPGPRDFQVLVDYAHSPDSLENIICSVREFTPGRVITLFGCGGDRDASKRSIMGQIAGVLSDYVVLTSDNPRTEDPQDIIKQIEMGISSGTYAVYVNRREAIFAAVAMLQKGDSLIIAGKGHENYQIIGTQSHAFDDYEVAREALALRS